VIASQKLGQRGTRTKGGSVANFGHSGIEFERLAEFGMFKGRDFDRSVMRPPVFSVGKERMTLRQRITRTSFNRRPG